MGRVSRYLLSTPNVAQPPESVAVESDFVVILAALLCALICVVGLVAVARCAWLRRDTGDSAAKSPANKGLKKKVLQSIPKITYDEKTKVVVAGECAICLAEYGEGDQIRVLPQCGHGFHATCVDAWLKSHSSCPSCRRILVFTRCRKCGEYPEICGNQSATIQIKANQEGGVSSTATGFLP